MKSSNKLITLAAQAIVNKATNKLDCVDLLKIHADLEYEYNPNKKSYSRIKVFDIIVNGASVKRETIVFAYISNLIKNNMDFSTCKVFLNSTDIQNLKQLFVTKTCELAGTIEGETISYESLKSVVGKLSAAIKDNEIFLTFDDDRVHVEYIRAESERDFNERMDTLIDDVSTYEAMKRKQFNHEQEVIESKKKIERAQEITKLKARLAELELETNAVSKSAFSVGDTVVVFRKKSNAQGFEGTIIEIGSTIIKVQSDFGSAIQEFCIDDVIVDVDESDSFDGLII